MRRKEKEKNDKKAETRATGRKVAKLGGEVEPRVFISLLYIYIHIHTYTYTRDNIFRPGNEVALLKRIHFTIPLLRC